MKKRIFVKVASIALIAGLVFSGCGSKSSSSSASKGSSSAAKAETTLEKAKESSSVTVGFANEKPYAYKDENGNLTGEAVEVARAVLKNMGITQINGELTEWDSLIPGLQASRYDMITAGMYITKERSEQVAFADPEYSIGEAIAVKAGNPKNIHSYADIAKDDTCKVATQGGTAEYDYLISYGVPKDRIVTVPDMPSALSSLSAGRVDVITQSGPSVEAVLKTANDSSVEKVDDFEQPEVDGKSVRAYGATAFRLEDKDFVEAFNTELNKMKESGELLQILQKFGFTEDELPGDMTTEKLLSEQ